MQMFCCSVKFYVLLLYFWFNLPFYEKMLFFAFYGKMLFWHLWFFDLKNKHMFARAQAREVMVIVITDGVEIPALCKFILSFNKH